MGAQAKTRIEFLYFEYGILKLRHILMIRRLMYHHSIITRSENETVYKVYNKQKESCIKGDWYEMLTKDFQFIGLEMDDQQIVQYSKTQYRDIVKNKVQQAAFNLYCDNKKIKISHIEYDRLETQKYLHLFGKIEVKILSQLRSKCYNAKANFSKMHGDNLKCIFNCNSTESQSHIFKIAFQFYGELRSRIV